MSGADPTLLSIGFRTPESIWFYLLYAAIGSLVLRLVLSFLRAVEVPKDQWGAKFKVAFRGFGESGENAANDYWQACLLGFLEICTLPVLIAINKPEYVAGWLILKTLPQWKRWSEARNVYNRFLIGNAGMLLISWLMARHFFA